MRLNSNAGQETKDLFQLFLSELDFNARKDDLPSQLQNKWVVLTFFIFNLTEMQKWCTPVTFRRKHLILEPWFSVLQKSFVNNEHYSLSVKIKLTVINKKDICSIVWIKFRLFYIALLDFTQFISAACVWYKWTLVGVT